MAKVGIEIGGITLRWIEGFLLGLHRLFVGRTSLQSAKKGGTEVQGNALQGLVLLLKER